MVTSVLDSRVLKSRLHVRIERIVHLVYSQRIDIPPKKWTRSSGKSG